MGVKGVVKFFSVDFNPIDTSLILDIQKFYIDKYIMKMSNKVKDIDIQQGT